MNAETFARTIEIQLRYTAWVFNANLAGLSDDAGLAQPDPAGNCANWVAGHILKSRVGALELLDARPDFDTAKYDRYGRGSEPVTGAADAVPLSEMRADFAATQEALLAGLRNLTVEALDAKAPFSPGGDEKETVGSLLAGLAFHEAYHAGQLGLLRRLSGADGAIA